MDHTPNRGLQIVGLALFISVVSFVVYLRSDGSAIFAGVGLALLVGIPISGLACVASALVSTRVRDAVTRHPVVYAVWAMAGAVVLYFIGRSVIESLNH